MQETQVQFLDQEDCPAERQSNPLQYSCLENPMDKGAWWAPSTGLQKNQIQLSDYTTTNWGMINTYSGEA